MKDKTLLSSMQLCARYGISVKSLDHWKLRADFPRNAASYTPDGQVWDYTKIDAWLRQRPIKTGPRPRWLAIVGHPAARGKGWPQGASESYPASSEAENHHSANTECQGDR